MTEAYWLAEPAKPLTRVSRDGRPDVVVIGGGVTGCSCALTLAEAGLRVRLFEARRVAWGASGRDGEGALAPHGAFPRSHGDARRRCAPARWELPPGGRRGVGRAPRRVRGA